MVSTKMQHSALALNLIYGDINLFTSHYQHMGSWQ